MSKTDLLGVEDLARLIGVKTETVYKYKTRGVLPEPDHVIGGSPIWNRATIDKWLPTRLGRRGPRPRKPTKTRR